MMKTLDEESVPAPVLAMPVPVLVLVCLVKPDFRF